MDSNKEEGCLWVSTELESVLLDRQESGAFKHRRDARGNLTVFYRLTPAVWGWLTRMMSRASKALQHGRVDPEDHAEALRRFQTVSDWAITNFGPTVLAAAECESLPLPRDPEVSQQAEPGNAEIKDKPSGLSIAHGLRVQEQTRRIVNVKTGEVIAGCVPGAELALLGRLSKEFPSLTLAAEWKGASGWTRFTWVGPDHAKME